MVHYSLPMKLRVLRAERGLTMQEAEEVTGVARETIGELERGLRNPHDVTLSKLAAGYGVPVGELLELAGKVEAPQEESGQPDFGHHDVYVVAPQVLTVVERFAGRPLTPQEQEELRATLEGARASNG